MCRLLKVTLKQLCQSQDVIGARKDSKGADGADDGFQRNVRSHHIGCARVALAPSYHVAKVHSTVQWSTCDDLRVRTLLCSTADTGSTLAKYLVLTQSDGCWCRYDDLSDSGVSVSGPQRTKLQGLAGGRASMERPTSLRGELLIIDLCPATLPMQPAELVLREVINFGCALAAHLRVHRSYAGPQAAACCLQLYGVRAWTATTIRSWRSCPAAGRSLRRL